MFVTKTGIENKTTQKIFKRNVLPVEYPNLQYVVSTTVTTTFSKPREFEVQCVCFVKMTQFFSGRNAHKHISFGTCVAYAYNVLQNIPSCNGIYVYCLNAPSFGRICVQIVCVCFHLYACVSVYNKLSRLFIFQLDMHMCMFLFVYVCLSIYNVP